MSIIRTENLTKQYGTGPTAVTALHNLNININHGEFIAVMGPSGCGKSTLLQLLGGLDTPSSGRIWLDNTDIATLNDDQLTIFRRQNIGFIFQFFNLIPVLTAGENIILPLILDGVPPAEAEQRGRLWLDRVNLANRWSHRPNELSGGQQQRVAVARALATNPTLILADEPTGNLDSRTADEIIRLLRQIASDYDRTILLVTHDPRMSAHANRIIFLKDGRIVDNANLTPHSNPIPTMEAIA
ncbi:MAG TPA: ABC transporter ATP-binding protein [Anaerolineae bacterium]|nr:ABC transporter ATP-binding protein [Anaerolineae bacterium]